jgi:hypothetical protein
VPEADQDHGAVSAAVAVALGGLDQLLDFTLGQMPHAALIQRSDAAAAVQLSVLLLPGGSV